MAKLGSEKRPIIVRVHSDEKARYVAEIYAEPGLHYINGFESDKPEDTFDLEKMLNPPKPMILQKIGRNDPCLSCFMLKHAERPVNRLIPFNDGQK